MFYHYSPAFGVFCPLIAVDGSEQNYGLGKSLLGLLQHLHHEKFKDNRIFVWLSYTTTTNNINEEILDDCKEGFQLYQYYQNLGFHLFPSLELPLHSCLPHDLAKKIMEVQVINQPNEEEHYKEKNVAYNFILGSNSCLNVNKQEASRVYEDATKNNHKSLVLKDNSVLRCDVCGLTTEIIGDMETTVQKKKCDQYF